MKKISALVFAVVLALSLGSMAMAADKEGKITKWESSSRTVTFEDGSQYHFSETTKTETIKEGARIKVQYETRDGKNWVTIYEVLQ
jgi:FKBP-type peptidyl-prolyl cis-trans isomerase